MSVLVIIGICAASITVIGFIVKFYKKFKKNNTTISERIDNIELSLNSKQRFILPNGTKVIIPNSNKIIILDQDEEFVLYKIENNMVSGKIFFNSIEIKLPLSKLGEEIK